MLPISLNNMSNNRTKIFTDYLKNNEYVFNEDFIKFIEDEDDADMDEYEVDYQLNELNHSIEELMNEHKQNEMNKRNKGNNENKHKYNAINLLNEGDDFLYNSTNMNINICAYHINNSTENPFLQFFLQKQSKDNGDVFNFPQFKCENCENVISKSVSFMEILCISYYKDVNYEYKGYLKYNDNVYLFFDCTTLGIDSVKLNRNNELWLVLIDEIINQKHVCNFKISEEVTDFFINNDEFAYLQDEETPIVVYNSCPKNRIDFTLIFGNTNDHFTDYNNSIKLDSKDTSVGLIRFAIFTKNMKIEKNNLDENWKNEYDSVYMCFEDYPRWVIKKYEQQTPLSGHIIKHSVVKDNELIEMV